jgi:hypothetical protein
LRGAQVVERTRSQQAVTLDVRVMVHDGDAVGSTANVELDAVGTDRSGPCERLERVLTRAT